VRQTISPQAGINSNAPREHPGRKEIVMNPIRRVATALAALAGGLLAFAAATPAAFASMEPPEPGGPVPPPVQVHTVVIGGTPGWQIALIAAGAALLAATAAVVVYRAWTARRRPVTAAA
jgi:hypothetical protein